MALRIGSLVNGRAISTLLLFVLTVSVWASGQLQPPPRTANAAPDIGPIVSPDVRKAAWEILATAATDNKASRRQNVIVAASTIRSSKAVSLVESLLRDKDSDVRAVAAAALAEMNSRRSILALRRALSDTSAVVRFAAAKSLWQLGDYSGREILTGVLQGESSPSDGVIKSNLRDANKKLHNPRELALAGLNAASGLFGPFSYGLTMAEQFATDKSASARALSASLLALDRNPASLRELQDALQDKNPAVRVAVVKALGHHPCRSVVEDLHSLLEEDKDEVKYMAAASILRISIISGGRHPEVCEIPVPAPAVAETIPESASKGK